MNYQFIINQRLPSLNEYLNKCKFNKHIAATFKEKVDRDIACEARCQLPDVKIEKPVILNITWIEENKRRDVDNVYSAVKYIQDALVKLQILKNDNSKWVKDVKNTIKYEPDSKVIVKIIEIENESEGKL